MQLIIIAALALTLLPVFSAGAQTPRRIANPATITGCVQEVISFPAVCKFITVNGVNYSVITRSEFIYQRGAEVLPRTVNPVPTDKEVIVTGRMPAVVLPDPNCALYGLLTGQPVYARVTQSWRYKSNAQTCQ
jgi:hypothetical protein